MNFGVPQKKTFDTKREHERYIGHSWKYIERHYYTAYVMGRGGWFVDYTHYKR